MNYQHLYHAGNFADVVKHVTLLIILKLLLQKEKPFSYIETHAGRGMYDLHSPAAQKTQEFSQGIAQLFSCQRNLPEYIQDYLAIIRELNAENNLRFYPGSPWIARQLLRSEDRMILMELHPKELALLKKEFYHDKQVAIHYIDGYQGLKAFLPPTPRRGLVLIDPPYESPNEFEHLLKHLKTAFERFPQGIFAIWYPIKNQKDHLRFHQKLKETYKEILLTELSIYSADSPLRLNGSGMIFINPPWQLDIKLKTILPWLWNILSTQKQGEYLIKWLRKI